MHFDPKHPIVLACDASAHGISAVLSHRFTDGSEKPIGFVSRTLTDTEKKYSQVEKEGLACVFGVSRFHAYLFGHKFTLVTDNKESYHYLIFPEMFHLKHLVEFSVGL